MEELNEVYKRLGDLEMCGAVRDQKIKVLEECAALMASDIRELKDKLINRLPLWATLFIAALTSVCTGMAVFNLTH